MDAEHEYIVDCAHVPYGDDLLMVLPISINGHVHERIIRCGDCDSCSESLPLYCRTWHTWVNDPNGFCHMARPKRHHG